MHSTPQHSFGSNHKVQELLLLSWQKSGKSESLDSASWHTLGSLTLVFLKYYKEPFIQAICGLFFCQILCFYLYLFVLVCYNGYKEWFVMYINITGSQNNKDVYIYQSYRKENGEIVFSHLQKTWKIQWPFRKVFRRQRKNDGLGQGRSGERNGPL